MKTKRKNIFKSLLALTLALIMVLGVAPLNELAGVDWASLFAPKAEAVGKTYKVGDIVEFGSYPQSKVTDSSLVSALNKASKNGSAMAITAARDVTLQITERVMLPWYRAIG